jgi:hypothetical protein
MTGCLSTRVPALGETRGRRGHQAAAGCTLALALLLGLPATADAQTRDRVWEGCFLDPTTLSNLQADLTRTGILDSPSVSFIVVYSLGTDNAGQPLTTGGATGPVICRASETSPSVATTTQTTGIGNTNLFDVAEGFMLRYGAASADAQMRFCHTVDSNVDCFRIGP